MDLSGKPLSPQEMMNLAVQKQEKESKARRLDGKILKAYPAIAPAFGLTAKEVKDRLYEVEDLKKDFVGGLADIFPNHGIRRVRVFPGQVQKLGDLLSADIYNKPVWKFMVEVWDSCEGLPVVMFKVKGYKDYFVITNNGGHMTGKETAWFYPRIKVPIKNQSNDVYIYTLDLYIKETV
jgi:hypothetical protein